MDAEETWKTGELSSLWVETICSKCLPRQRPADRHLSYIFSHACSPFSE